ncbi:MAG: GNAT family N-acetyltransferase [Bacteroidota bacterium]
MGDASFHIETINETEARVVADGLNTFNLLNAPAVNEMWTPIYLALKDENGTIAGGILAGVGYWNVLDIKMIWVREAYRGKSYGAQLLEQAEEQAKKHGAYLSVLDTFDFQARGFYEKQGYTVAGQIDDFPKDHTRFTLIKRLDT